MQPRIICNSRLAPAIALLLTCTSCSLDRTVASLVLDTGAGDSGVDTTNYDAAHWGQAAVSFPISPCVDGGVLLVDTTADTLEGGPTLSVRAAAGPTLSLREATYLAANTPGPHRITFDAQVFPAGAAATINITDETTLFPVNELIDTCIDARNRGVIVAFAHPSGASALAPCNQWCIWHLGAGSLMTGLVITGNVNEMRVRDAQVAGNRFAIDDVAVQANEGALIGPWNVFSHGNVGVETGTFTTMTRLLPRIEGNYFGVEPGSLIRNALNVAVAVSRSAEINANIVGSDSLSINGNLGSMRDNHLLRDVVLSLAGQAWMIGPGNVIEGTVDNQKRGAIGNHVFGNAINSMIGDGELSPPLSVAPGTVEGLCPDQGTVELSVRDGVLWAPVSSTPCAPDARWVLTSPRLTSGTSVATLFTSSVNYQTGPFSTAVIIP